MAARCPAAESAGCSDTESMVEWHGPATLRADCGRLPSWDGFCELPLSLLNVAELVAGLVLDDGEAGCTIGLLVGWAVALQPTANTPVSNTAADSTVALPTFRGPSRDISSSLPHQMR
jgi:hypothetical protein